MALKKLSQYFIQNKVLTFENTKNVLQIYMYGADN